MASRVITISEYQPNWNDMFAKEKAELECMLNMKNIIAIHHIGSTSVKGLCAKPIIDILIEVNCLDALDDDNHQMALIGYVAKGEYGIAGRRYFQKGDEQRTHQIHAFLHGSHAAKRHLAFRDYLIAHPKVATEYGLLKQQGAAMCNHDIDVYCEYKDSFVKEYEAKALAWKAAKNYI